MNELIGVHFSRQSQLSDPKGQGIRCIPIVHFATATVDWMLETNATAWLLANEHIPFRWITDDEWRTEKNLKLVYATAPDLGFTIGQPSFDIVAAPGLNLRDTYRSRCPISSDADLQDRHFAPGASLEGFHAIQAFNMISRLSAGSTIAEALKRPEVTKLIDVVLAPARAVIAASVPPPAPTPPPPSPPGMTELLKARDYIDQAIGLIGKAG